MTDIKNSGYKAAAVSALTTELNTLANDGWSALSAAIDNSANLYLKVDFELDLASITPTGLDAAVELYLVPSVDGTQYPSVSFTGSAEEQENQQYYVGIFMLSLSTEVHIHTLRDIELPPGLWKVGVRNRANVAFAASGNTVKWRPWQYSSV